MQEWVECINRKLMQIGAREQQRGWGGWWAVTQALMMPRDLQHSYKDSTRPPPCSEQDGATEGCSAVWNQSNKLLLRSGRDFSVFSKNTTD